MADAYGGFKSGKLKLKGEKTKKEKKKAKKREKERDEAKDERKRRKTEDQADRTQHGGWWRTTSFRHITGPVALQLRPSSYVRTLDDGGFTLGAPHGDGDGPDPEEVLLAVRVNDTKVAFKSGYEKYLRVDGRTGALMGVSDAVGPMEQFEPIFQVKMSS
jgi:protein FRG1